ncbi:17088_t:CDS:2, partial [Cetraspora pellucida]
MLTHISLLVVIIATIRWKYFIPTDPPAQQIMFSDIIFISGKYIIENTEECVTVAYASIVNTENAEHEFNSYNVPVCDPHVMFYVGVNRKPKETEDFIHFGIVGANIKVGNKYTISGHVKFSDLGKMMIEATDIDYVKGSEFNYNTSENSSSIKSNVRSIINVIADDVESTSLPIKKSKFSVFFKEDKNSAALDSYEPVKTSINVDKEYRSSSE